MTDHHGRRDGVGDTWIHVPPPGERYAPANGSSLVTVASALAAEHARRGGLNTVVVRDDLPHQPAGEVLLPYRGAMEPLTGAQWQEDTRLAAAGRRRRHFAAYFEPVLRAIPPMFDGPVLLHNAPAAVAELRRRRSRARPVLYLHCDLFRTFGTGERAAILADCDLVVCVSDFIAERFLAGLAGGRGKVLTAVNGVDPVRFPAAQPGGDGPPVVAFVGRLAPEKGALLLVDAARRLRRAGHRFMLRMVGNEALEAGAPLTRFELAVRRRAAPLGESVEFRPFLDRDAIARAYRDVEILCVPSLCEEACPLVLLEGLSSGLACVATRRGGIPEVGLDAVVYFDYRRPSTLDEALAGLLRDVRLRRRLQRSARRRGLALSWSSRYELIRNRLALP